MANSKCQRPGCANPADNKYCSRSCAARVNNRRPKRKKRLRLCLCGTELSHTQQKYCSSRCQWEGKHGSQIRGWLEGRTPGGDSRDELRNVFRLHLLREAGEKCTRCGWAIPNPYMGKVILTVDHIDGNWKNNKRDNLVVLCYNCHTLTPTFGSLNRASPGRRPGGTRAVRS
jgi:hypothetical protein